MRTVYADNAGTTRLSETALNAMLPYLRDKFGNPSSVYSFGREAKKAVEESREKIAAALDALPSEIYFTGSGTEADNWAIRGAFSKNAGKVRHVITTAIEHHAVLNTAAALEKNSGAEVTFLPVNKFGQVDLQEFERAVKKDTILVSIMTANNEIGTILPIEDLCAAAHARGVLFHTDAVQAVGHIPVSVKKTGVDMLSLSAHKFCGPKGVGVLYIKRGAGIPAFLTGGGQERTRRSGTENVAGIVGAAAALEESARNMNANIAAVTAMRDRLISGLLKIPYSFLTGDPVNRLPGTASFIFECVEGESMILGLDREGIAASSGSACSSGSLDPSHVLLAIGLSHEAAHGSVRLTVNENNSEEDVDYILEKMPPVIEKLRAMSPLWEEKIK
ncbi:MAG: cysteine desulfurase NifS [Oscillospiraceae bacterium]|nr:cysteine desulfurase NifS [Oscillospiraceae bacterium]